MKTPEQYQLELEMVGETLERIIEGEPLDRLGAADELVNWTSRLRQSVVDQARETETWEKIGTMLGVTRQAAQSKYGR